MLRWWQCRVSSVAVIAGLLLLCANAGAMWAELTQEQLIDQSELIATGQVIGTTRMRLAAEGVDTYLAVVRLDKVYKGDSKRAIAHVVIPAPTPGLHSTVITYTTGQAGLWYLRLRAADDDGIYLADHPQRFVPIEHMEKALQGLDSLPRSRRS
jgi:hypothetical protein